MFAQCDIRAGWKLAENNDHRGSSRGGEKLKAQSWKGINFLIDRKYIYKIGI